MLNKAQLIGRLGRDPDIRYTQEGNCIAHLALATSEFHQDKASGERRETTEWHRVVLFGRVGEIAGEYLKKGSLVFIEGRIRTRKWLNPSGQNPYATEILGSELKMLGSRSDQAGSGLAAKPETSKSAERADAGPAPAPIDGGFEFDDEIPF